MEQNQCENISAETFSRKQRRRRLCKNSFEALMFFCMLEGFSLIDFERQKGEHGRVERKERRKWKLINYLALHADEIFFKVMLYCSCRQSI